MRRFLKLLKREFFCFFVSSSFQLTLVASEAFFKSFKNSVQGAKVNSLREEKRDLGQGVGGEKAFFKSFKNSVQGAKVISLREEKRDLGQGVGGEKTADVWRVQGAKVNSLREEKGDLGQGVVRREGKVGEGR